MSIYVGGELYLYGAIGENQCGDGITPAAVAAALAEHGPADLTVHINSGGGIATDGMAIYSILRAHPGKKKVVVDGIAASAASLIAMAGDEIVMRDGAMLMIHNPMAITAGNQKAHLKTADVLGKLSENYARIYAQRRRKR